MLVKKASGFFLVIVALAGCTHHWPREGQGGVAERDAPRDPAISAAVQAIRYLQQSPGIRAPSKVAEADDLLVRATRESEACLTNDARKSYDEAVVLLGAVPQKITQVKTRCKRNSYIKAAMR